MSIDKKVKLSLACRLCANIITNSILVPLHFSIDSKKEPPIVMIQRFTNNLLEIREDDNLPQQICNDCLKKINLINEYIAKIIKAQNRLQKFFISKNKTEHIEIQIIKNEVIEETDSFSSEEKCKINYPEIEFSEDEYSDSYFNDDFKEDFRFICHICSVEFKTAWSLERHISKDHIIKENELILCEHCGESLSKRTYLRHIEHLDVGTSYQCKYCGEIFLSNRSLCQHNSMKHSDKNDLEKESTFYSCPICKRKFKNLVYMHKHQIMNHNKDREQNPRYRPHSCSYCGQVYGRSDHLKIHIKRVHLKQMDHKCIHCGKGYGQRFQLNQHYKLAHSEKTIYKCEHCLRTYLNFKRYKEHVYEHSNVPEFKCVLCGMLFHKSMELKKHEAFHDKESKRIYENQIEENMGCITDLTQNNENDLSCESIKIEDEEIYEVDYLQDDDDCLYS